MKKVFSIVLAVVMLFAVCVPAFAAEITTDGGTGDSVVKTLQTDEGGNSAEKFTVTFPAETTIPWLKTTAVDIAYTVESHLAYGKYLTVEVTNDGANTMKYTPEAGAEPETLAYTLSDTLYTATSPVVNPTAGTTNAKATVTVAETDWNNAIIGEYADTLTFTATVNTTVAP